MNRFGVIIFLLGINFTANFLSLGISLYKRVQISNESGNPSFFKEEIREEVLKNKLLKSHQEMNSLTQGQNQ